MCRNVAVAVPFSNFMKEGGGTLYRVRGMTLSAFLAGHTDKIFNFRSGAEENGIGNKFFFLFFFCTQTTHKNLWGDTADADWVGASHLTTWSVFGVSISGFLFCCMQE